MLKGCFINNAWVETGERLAVTSPWSGETVGEVTLAGEPEWEAALAAAQSAAVTMRAFSSLERREMLARLAAGVKARQEELARIIVAEGGKPITYARLEIGRGVLTLTLAAEEAARIGGEVLPLDLTATTKGRWGLTRRFPLGPVLGISPFNFPFNLVAHKVGPALAAGNPIIVKPPSATPLTALKLAEIYAEAGLLPGGLQVLPSSSRVAEKYVADDRLKALSFTGSAAVGWRLKEKAGRKKVTLELGGNAACIVDADADLALAAARAATGAFSHAGQVCIAVKRLLVHQDIYEAFKEKFLRVLQEKVVTGDPLQENTVVGPLISAMRPRPRSGSGSKKPWTPGRDSPPGAWGKGTGCRPRCWKTSPGRWRCGGKKSSGRWWRWPPLAISTRPWRWPTTPTTGSRPASLPGTWPTPGRPSRPWRWGA